MLKYTVVLLRTGPVLDPDSAGYTNSYMAHVEADGLKDAVTAAKKQAHLADGLPFNSKRSDYKVVVIFEGWLTAIWYGWQN